MEEFNTMPKSRRPKRGSAFLAGIIGVVVGALLVWILTPTKNAKQSNEISQNQDADQTERVNFDIHTDVTDVVGEVANSVVGVTNLQTVRDIWSTI